jgi:hypothetical protein
MGNGSLTPICSSSKRSLSPSLTVSVSKVVYILGGLGFFQILTFLLTKVPREGNLFAKKVPSSANLA